jgi:hypothetical protein
MRFSPLVAVIGGLAAIAVFSTVPVQRELYMSATAVVLVGLRPRLLLDYLRTLARLTVFFASYLLLAWLFHTQPEAQERFLLHVGFLLLISVWWVRSIAIDELYAELVAVLPRLGRTGLREFLHGVTGYLPLIALELREGIRGRRLRISEAINVLEIAFRQASARTHEICIPSAAATPRSLFVWGNLLVVLGITLVSCVGLLRW